jgi:hypothetical protein
MNIEEAIYIKDPLDNKNVNVKITIDGVVMFVPMVETNRHYAEILKQVKEGKLTIKDAE